MIRTQEELNEALIESAENNDIEEVRRHIYDGADVKYKGGGDDRTALHQAAVFGWDYMTNLLIEAGSDVNATNYDRQSPLHLAAWAGRLEVIRILIEKGADVNLGYYYGDTPALQARINGQRDALKLIKSHGGWL